MKRVLQLLLVVALFGGTLVFTVNEGHSAFDLFGAHKTVKAVDGNIKIPVTDVNDGKAHYFKYKGEEVVVKFFVVKSKDGVIRAAFDACDVCFSAKKGYSQDGDFMICNNCGRRFHSSRINVVEGGCNPAPLARKVVGKELVIEVKDVVPGGRFF